MVAVIGALALCLASAIPIPGADPTGKRDSSAALNAHLQELCATGPQPPKGQCRLDSMPVERVLDLDSGVYRMESPLQFGRNLTCSGPVRVRDGTLLAGAGIADGRFLVEAVDYIGQRKVGFALSFEHVVFASNHTGGGLLANRSSFVTVSDCNFINFRTFGVWTSGADFRLDRTVLMECTDGMAQCAHALGATAVYIDGADSHFNRNVVACTGRGFVNWSGDNRYHQNHVWTNCVPPQVDRGAGDNNTVGFLIHGSGGVVMLGNTIDNCHLIVEGYRGLAIEGSHFNENARLVLLPNAQSAPQLPVATDPRCQYWRGAMCSLRVAGNTFTCGNLGTCGHIDVSGWLDSRPLSAQQVQVLDNTWENQSWSMCSDTKGHCNGVDDCGTLFGTCHTSGRGIAAVQSDGGGHSGRGNSGDDVVEQLERLMSWHTAGRLTESEFVAAKASVLFAKH